MTANGIPDVAQNVVAAEPPQYTITGYDVSEEFLLTAAGQLFNALAMVRLGQCDFAPQGAETPEEHAARMAHGAELAVSMMLKPEQEALALYANGCVRMIAHGAIQNTRYGIEPVEKRLIKLPGER